MVVYDVEHVKEKQFRISTTSSKRQFHRSTACSHYSRLVTDLYGKGLTHCTFLKRFRASDMCVEAPESRNYFTEGPEVTSGT